MLHTTGAGRMEGGRVARVRRQDGGIITGWLIQLVAILAVISLVVHEVVAIGVATVSVDEAARDGARAASAAYRSERSLSSAREAAEGTVSSEATEVVSLTEVDGELVITLHKRARTLLVHRVGPLEGLATPSTTRRIRWQS
jgi:hypothetical protein